MFLKIAVVVLGLALSNIMPLPASAQSSGAGGIAIDLFGGSKAVEPSWPGVIPSSGITGKVQYLADEPFSIYEDWSNATIRSDRWTGRDDPAQEIKREVKGNTLQMRYRREGSVSSIEGFAGVMQRMNTKNPSDIDEIEVDFIIKKMTVSGCPTNLIYKTRLRPAQISLAKFNDGTSAEPTDQTGDHFIRVLVNREADSTDPKGVLTVQAFVFRCIDNVCSNAISNTGQFNLSVGKVKLNQAFTLRAVWDAPNNRFMIGLNGDPDVVLAYAPILNQGPAVVSFAQFGMQLVASNCAEGPTVTDAETWVGEVRTNPSAIIP